MKNQQFFDMCIEGEQLIKTYECTSIKKMFFGTSKGRLTVTNKRILYHSTGKSIKGVSITLNEMPVDDVSGVSSYLGSSINWIGVIIFMLAMSYVISPLVFEIFPREITGKVFAGIMILPFLIRLIWNKNIISTDIMENILENIKPVIDNDIIKKVPKEIALKAERYLLCYGIFLISSDFFERDFEWLMFLVYVGLYFILFGMKRTFSFILFSKSTKGAGINLPGVQQFKFLNFKSNDTTATDTMSGEPDRDSELIIKEIGAMIMDLKQMGDLAIEKWGNLKVAKNIKSVKNESKGNGANANNKNISDEEYFK